MTNQQNNKIYAPFPVLLAFSVFKEKVYLSLPFLSLAFGFQEKKKKNDFTYGTLFILDSQFQK